MSSIDESIQSGKRKRKILVIGGSIALTTVLMLYFGFLFLMQGHNVIVFPDETSKTQRFAVVAGVGLFIENKLYSLGGATTISVGADKFETKQVVIESGSDSNIKVTLEPLPAKVLVNTQPVTQDIAWSIDGKPHSQGQSFDASLQPGTYQIQANHPAFEDAYIDIVAEIGGEFLETITLTPISGQISFKSNPSGAEVKLNGQLVGTTPLTVNRPGGEYAVTVSYQGYEVLDDKVTVAVTDKAPSRNYFLTPLQASLNISLSPAGGALLVNGSPAQSPLSVDANKAHSIRYEKTGYIAQKQTVTLKPAQAQNVRFSLVPEMGDVQFQANEVSNLYINGQQKGSTPLTLSLQTLPTDIEFRKEGYRTIKKKVQPLSGKRQMVSVEILKEFEARRKEGRPLFVSTLDIEMTRIAPKQFVMGSPVNETGRSRNEHQHDVAFARNIWVSRHEITESQFSAFKKGMGNSKMPVTNISWLDAVAYTNWLSEQEGLMPFYAISNGQVAGVNEKARGYRLLTEAEWEFIAKKNRRASPTKYVWGGQDRMRDKQGNFADQSLRGQQTFILPNYNDGFAGKAPVGSFKADRGGIYDLDGNVREWVHDFYTVSPQDTSVTKVDYLGTPRGKSHVIKGGSFKTGRLKNLRTSVRSSGSKGEDDISFRIARYHN